jgi:hypothetical protein
MQTTTWRSKSRLRLADSIQRLRRLRIESGYDVERRNRSIASAALHNSRQELLSSVPTTFAGLHALVVYVHSANSDLFPDSDDSGIFLQSVAAALTSFVGSQAVQS